MEDQSYLDKRYFVEEGIYNCPFCNRNHVPYTSKSTFFFDWGKDKKCLGVVIRCNSCKKESLHLLWDEMANLFESQKGKIPFVYNGKEYQLDDLFFYHQPTSFFTIDDRINKTIRELITEAEGCQKMNYLIGASACLRKAIYEILSKEEISPEVGDYSTRIKTLKSKFQHINPAYFDVLDNIKDMTSDNLHEESWESFDSTTLKELLEAMKSILYEMYVLPDEKIKRLGTVPKLLEKFKKDKGDTQKSE